MKNETVLCLPRKAVTAIIRNVLTRGGYPCAYYTLPWEEMLWERRTRELENDTSLLQVIPYCVVECPKPEGRKLLLYRRSAGGSEKRLLGKWSCGFGGHVSLQDCEEPQARDFISAVWTCRKSLEREFYEELHTVPSIIKAESTVLYTPDDPRYGIVDRVHLGLVFSAVLSLKTDLSPTAEISHLRWVDVDGIQESVYPEQSENWTATLLAKYSKQPASPKGDLF